MRKAIAIAAIGLMAACGTEEPRLSADVSTELSQYVADVRSAAEAGDQRRAEGALTRLRERLLKMLAAGEIGEDPAAEISTAAERVFDELAAIPAATTAPPTTTTAPPPTTPPRAEHDEPGSDRGNKNKDGDEHDD